MKSMLLLGNHAMMLSHLSLATKSLFATLQNWLSRQRHHRNNILRTSHPHPLPSQLFLIPLPLYVLAMILTRHRHTPRVFQWHLASRATDLLWAPILSATIFVELLLRHHTNAVTLLAHGRRSRAHFLGVEADPAPTVLPGVIIPIPA